MSVIPGATVFTVMPRPPAAWARAATLDFTQSMTGDTFVEQMDRTRALREENLDYWGVAIFGLKEVIDSITRKFSFWRL